MAKRHTPDRRARLVFTAVMVLWLILPFAMRDRLAQDAVPFLTAGALAHQHPDQIYKVDAHDLWDLKPLFGAHSCAISLPGTDCATKDVAFVSPPQALPFSWLVAQLGRVWGIIAMRLLGAAALVGGMAVLWQRLAHRNRHAGTVLAVSALCLTPFVMVPLGLGQNSPLMFLSACLGLTRTERSRGWTALVVVVWVATISFKATPIALVVVLLVQRRWRILGWATALGAALTAGALALVPASSFHEFLKATRRQSSIASINPYNGAPNAVLHAVWRPLTSSHLTGVVLVLLGITYVGVTWFVVVRHRSADAQWAWAWLALLPFLPLLWWHYLWVSIAALGVALSERRRVDDRSLWIFLAFVLVTIPIAIPNASGHSVQVPQGLYLLAVLVAVPALLYERRVSDPGPATSPAPSQPTLAGR
jgi:hypothetical protein